MSWIFSVHVITLSTHVPHLHICTFILINGVFVHVTIT